MQILATYSFPTDCRYMGHKRITSVYLSCRAVLRFHNSFIPDERTSACVWTVSMTRCFDWRVAGTGSRRPGRYVRGVPDYESVQDKPFVEKYGNYPLGSLYSAHLLAHLSVKTNRGDVV